MGKKSDIKAPEAYDLQELLDSQVKLNRFDSENPWGTQTWNTLPDGRMKMSQDINPELQTAMDKQIAYANKDAEHYTPNSSFTGNANALGSLLAQRAGMDGFQEFRFGQDQPQGQEMGASGQTSVGPMAQGDGGSGALAAQMAASGAANASNDARRREAELAAAAKAAQAATPAGGGGAGPTNRQLY